MREVWIACSGRFYALVPREKNRCREAAWTSASCSASCIPSRRHRA